MTTTRSLTTTRPETRTRLEVPKNDESDSESFHSAISSVTKATSRPSHGMKSDDEIVALSGTIKQTTLPNSRPRARTTTSHNSNSPTITSQKSQSRKHNRSKRPCQQQDLPVPSRRSSLPVQKQQHRLRKDSAALHSLSCKLFSSLDGMMAMSRDITPLPSVSTSRTTTRQASLVPERSLIDEETFRQVCAKIDARLAASLMESRRRAEEDPYADEEDPYSGNSPCMSPTQPSFDPTISEQSSLISRPPPPPASDPDRDAPQQLELQKPPLNNVISWTSTATRRAEYAKIDRAHSGTRGFARRIWPQCLRKRDGRRNFFGGECDGDSVRRFRMDVEEGDSGDDEQDVFDEKDALEREYAGLSVVTVLKPEVVEVKKPKETKTAETKVKAKVKKPWWSCFEL